MLQRLRNRDRSERDERDWSARTDDPYGSRIDPVADDDYADHFARRRRKKRSAAGRVAKTAFIAFLFMGLAAGAYYFARSGLMTALLGRGDAVAGSAETAPPALPIVTDVAPVAAETAPAPATPAPSPPPQQAAELPVPSVEGLVMLIRNSVVALHQANLSGNYSVLRDIAGPDFQAANTPADLSDIFTALRERKLDLARITVVNPRLHAEPVVDAEGLLRLTGFFTADTTQVDFDLLLKASDGRWRLFGIGLAPVAGQEGETAPPLPAVATAGTVPDAATLVTLIRGTVIALNQANLTGNYSVLRDIGAPGFGQANDLVKLASIFSELRARELDLAPITIIDPQLFRPAEIDKDGYLRLTGFFPSRPEQVNFDLAFQFVEGKWMLFGVGLNTSREVPLEEAAASSASEAAPVASDGQEPAIAPASTPRVAGTPPTPRLRPLPPPPPPS